MGITIVEEFKTRFGKFSNCYITTKGVIKSAKYRDQLGAVHWNIFTTWHVYKSKADYQQACPPLKSENYNTVVDVYPADPSSVWFNAFKADPQWANYTLVDDLDL